MMLTDFEELKPPPPRPVPAIRDRVQKLLDDPMWRLAKLAGEVIAIFAGLCALYLSIEQTRIANNALLDQRISAAWQILAQPGAGSTGKTYALETLIAFGESLTNIDLGCRQYASEIVGREICVAPVDLRGIQLIGTRSSSFSPNDLQNVNFSWAEFGGGVFKNLLIVSANFDHSKWNDGTFENVNFSNASFVSTSFFQMKWKGGMVAWADFSNTRLPGINFENVRFGQGINISGTRFCFAENFEDSCVRGLTNEFFEVAWFWKDSPPTGLEYLDPNLMIREGCARGPSNSRNTPVGLLPKGCDEQRPRVSVRNLVSVYPALDAPTEQLIY